MSDKKKEDSDEESEIEYFLPLVDYKDPTVDHLQKTKPSLKAAKTALKEARLNLLTNLEKANVFPDFAHVKNLVKPHPNNEYGKSADERVYIEFDVEMQEMFGTLNSNNCGPADFARALCDHRADKTFFFGYPCPIPPEDPKHKNPAKIAQQKALAESHDIAFHFMKGYLEMCGLHIDFIHNTNKLTDYKRKLQHPANEAERQT